MSKASSAAADDRIVPLKKNVLRHVGLSPANRGVRHADPFLLHHLEGPLFGFKFLLVNRTVVEMSQHDMGDLVQINMECATGYRARNADAPPARPGAARQRPAIAHGNVVRRVLGGNRQASLGQPGSRAS